MGKQSEAVTMGFCSIMYLQLLPFSLHPPQKKKKKCQKRAVTGVKRGSLHTASKTDCRTKPEGIFEGLGDSSSCMNDINIFVFPGWLLNYDLHL